MKIRQYLNENATKNDVKTAIGLLPAPAPLQIARVLGVSLKGGKFAKVNAIFEKNTLHRIIGTYNNFVAVKNGQIEIFKNTLDVSLDVFKSVLPVIELLIAKNGDIDIADIVIMLKAYFKNNESSESVTVSILPKTKNTPKPKTKKKNGLDDYRELVKKAKALGFKGRGKKAELIKFIDSKK